MRKIKLYPSNIEINCDDGQSVLSALEKHGHALPNNCRAGACGECKVKVRSGTFDQGFVLAMALKEDEKAQGFGLMCMARPTSDILEIEWGDETARPKLFGAEENRVFMVTEKTMVTDKILKLRLRSLGPPMRFWPGQNIQLGSKDLNIPYRSYSIANIPGPEGEIILFVTKIKEGTTSAWIHDILAVGEKIKINGPYGTFIGDPNTNTPVLCLAAGSGLAPIESLSLGALLRGGFKNPVTILFSAQYEKDIFELGTFKFLESKFRNFKFKATLTQEKSPKYLEGRIPQLLPTLYPDLSKSSIYICGSVAFVRDCKEAALKLKARPELIYIEEFVSA